MKVATALPSSSPAGASASTRGRRAAGNAVSTTAAGAPERSSARDRLLAAADELFYEGGIHTVGIDRVIERAGVAKASLYGTFGSKDALIQAYLEARHDARKARITTWLERYDSPRERLLGVFDAMADLVQAKTFRGCPFTRASSESEPTSGVRSACDNARQWIRELFAQLARETGVADAEGLATQLSLLYDGAAVMGQIEQSTRAALAARAAAAVLLDQATERAKEAHRTTSRRRR